jgi:predicted nucleic acid-binding protein
LRRHGRESESVSEPVLGIGRHWPSEPSFAYVVQWVTRSSVEDIATSAFVLAEIRHGIELKRRSDHEQAKSLDRSYSQMRTRLAGRVLPIGELVAEAWVLLGVPNPLPLIDGLLAATAKVHGLTFVTRNVADLAVTGVPLLDPLSGA